MSLGPQGLKHSCYAIRYDELDTKAAIMLGVVQSLYFCCLFLGLGSAFTNAATYSVLGKYFPGRQLAPYAAITVCQNVGVMVTPQIVGRLTLSLSCQAILVKILYSSFFCFGHQ